MEKLINEDKLIVIKKLFMTIAESKVSGKYVISKENKNKYDSILRYFLGLNTTLNTNKGLILSGDYGTGKSTLFVIIRELLNIIKSFNKNTYAITSVEELIDLNDKITDSLYCFNLKDDVRAQKRDPRNIIVNEFGHDYDIKKYGTTSEAIIESFIMKRYDIYQQFNKLTHFTTNKTFEEIEKKYPAIIVDRLVGMCNFVELKGHSHRK